MPILLLGAIALFGLGYWEYKRGAFGPRLSPGGVGTPNLPPVLPANASAQQIVAQDAPSLVKEILDLLYNGRDPRAMHFVASELEKDGFFDAAAILHKRAGELEVVQVPTPSGSMNPGMGVPPNQQGGGGIPGAPGAPSVSLADVAIQNARNQIAQINVAYNALDNSIKTYLARVASPTNPNPQFLLNSRSWAAQVAQWRNFQVEGLTAQNLPQMLQNLATYTQALSDWDAAFRKELGTEVFVPVSQSPSAPSISRPGLTQTGPGGLRSPQQVVVPKIPNLFSGEGKQ